MRDTSTTSQDSDTILIDSRLDATIPSSVAISVPGAQNESEEIYERDIEDTTYKQVSTLENCAPESKPFQACPNDSSEHFGDFPESRKFRYVSIPPLLVPRSSYQGERVNALPLCDERSALSDILNDMGEAEDEPSDFNEILLDDFVIYRPASPTFYPWQMVTLDSMVSNREGCRYLLNGILRHGTISRYIKGAEIDIDQISIDGLEDPTIHTVQDEVYLQTTFCARRRHKARRCWYRLLRPSEEYRSLHQKFLWVADLAKHVIDYLHWRCRTESTSRTVHLRDFRSDFLDRLMIWHGQDNAFLGWLRWYDHKDFRIPMNRYREFIVNRAFNLDDIYMTHELWSELMVRPAVENFCKNLGPEDTIVTPYVYHCCKGMPWAYVLRQENRNTAVEREHARRARRMGFSMSTTSQLLSCMAGSISETASLVERAAKLTPMISVHPYDVLHKFAIVRMKQSKVGSTKHDFSYVYIQGVKERRDKIELKVVFICLPSETMCLDGYYPHGNELFLTDACNCSAQYEPILLKDVVQLVEVTFGDATDMVRGFFIRQKYLYYEDIILRARESDFRCPCRRSTEAKAVQEEPTTTQKSPLPGLGLFAGCGNFDLGLEKAGAIKFLAAIEINEAALKTYAANRDQGADGLILDSVNPCLSKILQGGSELPEVGSVSFICCGSPCKGFSLINTRRDDEKGMRNCSLLASALSYIETYLPAYAIFENVAAMGSGVGNSGNQAIACLVGLGYQVRKSTLSSRSFGSPQRRERLFIIAASPNVLLPREPEPVRTAETGFAKASEISRGLPSVDNDDRICIPFPDHIPGARQTPVFRELIRRIPRYPRGMNLLTSIRAGYQGPLQMEWFWQRKSICNNKRHLAFTRIDPDGPVSTVVATPSPACGFGGGRIIHWDEHRTLTLLEVRRAQGFPDEDVIIGGMPQQWSQVGNAVNRQVATALGKVIADSWYSSPASVERDVINPKRQQSDCEAGSNNAAEVEHDRDRPTSDPSPPRLLAEEISAETMNLGQECVGASKPEVIVAIREDLDDAEDPNSIIPIPHDTEDEDQEDSTTKDRNSKPDLSYLKASDCLGSSKFCPDEIEMLKGLFEPSHHTGGIESHVKPESTTTLHSSPNQPFKSASTPSASILQNDPTDANQNLQIVLRPKSDPCPSPSPSPTLSLPFHSTSTPTITVSKSHQKHRSSTRQQLIKVKIEIEILIPPQRKRGRGYEDTSGGGSGDDIGGEDGEDGEDDGDGEDIEVKNWIGRRRVRSRFSDV